MGAKNVRECAVLCGKVRECAAVDYARRSRAPTAVPLYPDVSERVRPVLDVSCAASLGAKTPTASAVITVVS